MSVISTKEYAEALRAVAESGKSVETEIFGSSMLPFLAPHRDAALLESLKRVPARGDVVFCRIPPLQENENKEARYVLHRVKKVTADGAYIIGDAQNVCEGPVPLCEVFGIVTSVRRKGKILRPENLIWKFFSGPWLWIVPMRRPLFRLASLGKKRRGGSV